MGNEEIIKIIEAIIKRGNDVEIRRKGDGYIVLEVKNNQIFFSRVIGRGKGQSEPSKTQKNACCLALFFIFPAKSAKQRGF